MLSPKAYGLLGIACGCASLLLAMIAPNQVSPELAGSISLAVLGAGFTVASAITSRRRE